MSDVAAATVPAKKPRIWGEVFVLPENRSAVFAVRRVGKALAGKSSRPLAPPLLLLHGPPGVGKSALVQQLVRDVIAGPAVRTAQVLPAKELPGAETDSLADLLAADLLIIEDLQHLSLKDVVPFCRLLDQRAARQRPSVFTSSTGPAGLHEFPRRLTSRLAAGLAIRLDPPNVDSRRLLASHFAARRKVPLTLDALDWLAERSVDGIRTLQGLIERLRPLSRRYAHGISRAQAIAWLADSEMEASRPTLMERIVTRVCSTYRVKPRDVLGGSRLRSVLVPRQVAMHLAKSIAKLPLAAIGAHFGGRDHTTVLHAVNKIAADLKTDAQLALIVKEIRSEFV